MIGKGGASVKQIFSETNTRINIADAPEGDAVSDALQALMVLSVLSGRSDLERLVTITGTEQSNCPYSGAQVDQLP